MNDRLRIAMVADPELPIPPEHYGGIERIIHFLVSGLTHNGHEVVLFAHRESRVCCELVPYRGRSSQSFADVARNTTTIARHVWAGGFDVVHSFGRLVYLAPLAPHPVRKIMSYQRPITPARIRQARLLFRSSIQFTACSRHMTRPVESLASWHVVHNGVRLDAYTFRSRVPPDAPLVFLGRVEEIKGPHLAIQAARAAGRSLVIAGNVQPEHQRYFDERIRPHLDGTTVTYIGSVGDREKNELLGRASALLMPVLWDEPFGIVMAEALACGTPVIGFRRGSVPEVVTDGVTGFLASAVTELVAGIQRLEEIDRHACRTSVERRFSDAVIVRAYESLYRTHKDGGHLDSPAVSGLGL